MKVIIIFSSLWVLYEISWAQMCKPREFQCDNGECIWAVDVCDQHIDCSDESDENQEICKKHEFECANGERVKLTRLCDGNDDCSDGSDERDENGNCPECPEYAFQCASDVRCIPSHWVCDSYADCEDGSDEPKETCYFTTFQHHQLSGIIH